MPGRKVWTQETLSVPDLQGFLQDQVVMKFASASERDLQLPQPEQGNVAHLASTGALTVYDSGKWLTWDTRPQSYTPQWVMQSVGNSTPYGRYWRRGRMCFVTAGILAGSSTSLGTGGITCSLPFTAAAAGPVLRWRGRGEYLGTVGDQFLDLVTAVGSGESVASVVALTSANKWATPGSLGYGWTTNSQMSFGLEYETA